MKYTRGDGRKKDLSTVIYNPYITITDVPLEAYDYVVNGKPAIQWVMERQGIINRQGQWTRQRCQPLRDRDNG